MPNDLVSVMMPAYNAEEYIGQAIESVLAQTYPHWELLIINDGSTDRTAEIAGQYGDPRIHIFHQSNQGEAAARNLALKEIQGEYVAFLDADDQFLPRHLELTADTLKSRPSCGGVYTDGYYINHAGRKLQRLSSQRRGPFNGDIFEELVRASDVFGPPICTTLRNAVIQVHDLIFDTRIVIGPDWDFMTRFAELAEFAYIDLATCLYRVHETNISRTTDLSQRNLSLARCREKAIKLPSFIKCSVATRSYTFYDMLVNHLYNQSDCQQEVTSWKEFHDLPQAEQAKLLRLMASQALLGDVANCHVAGWFRRAVKLSPLDVRNRLLWVCFRISPALCRELLKLRRKLVLESKKSSPFAASL